jgi:[ribosomal protein S5]-alanine N-acetyltransferase
MFFETERLFARKLTMEDILPFQEMQSNENVMKYISGRPKTNKESAVELEKILKSYNYIVSEFLIMAVVRKENNEFIGTCAIIKNEDGEYEIGYRTAEKYWGNGYGKEIVEELVKFAFQDLYLDQIVAYVDKKNYASVKILDNSKLNFIREYMGSATKDSVRYYKLSKSSFFI